MLTSRFRTGDVSTSRRNCKLPAPAGRVHVARTKRVFCGKSSREFGGLAGMRSVLRVMAIAGITASLPAFAQQWLDYVNREYRFAVNFPVAPKAQDTSHTSANGTRLRARSFSADQGTSHYRVTVVSYPDAADAAGEIAHAARLVRSKGKAFYDARGDYDGIPAQDLFLTSPQGRQIVVAVLFHDRRLYIVEADVGADAAPPIQFQQSIAITDADGKPIKLE
jgi:hypothetical protein